MAITTTAPVQTDMPTEFDNRLWETQFRFAREELGYDTDAAMIYAGQAIDKLDADTAKWVKRANMEWFKEAMSVEL